MQRLGMWRDLALPSFFLSARNRGFSFASSGCPFIPVTAYGAGENRLHGVFTFDIFFFLFLFFNLNFLNFIYNKARAVYMRSITRPTLCWPRIFEPISENISYGLSLKSADPGLNWLGPARMFLPSLVKSGCIRGLWKQLWQVTYKVSPD